MNRGGIQDYGTLHQPLSSRTMDVETALVETGELCLTPAETAPTPMLVGSGNHHFPQNIKKKESSIYSPEAKKYLRSIALADCQKEGGWCSAICAMSGSMTTACLSPNTFGRNQSTSGFVRHVNNVLL